MESALPESNEEQKLSSIVGDSSPFLKYLNSYIELTLRCMNLFLTRLNHSTGNLLYKGQAQQAFRQQARERGTSH